MQHPGLDIGHPYYDDLVSSVTVFDVEEMLEDNPQFVEGHE